MLKVLSPLLALTLMAQNPPPEPPRPAAPRVQPMPPKADAPEPKDSDVIAYLGKTAIRYGDFSAWLGVMAGPRAESMRKQAATRNQAQKQYLDLQVLAAKGRQEKLQDTKAFKALVEALKQQAYARVLMDEDRPGGDGQKLKAEAENPSEADLLAYFNANSERYATPEKFTARHILVSLKAGDQAVPEADALAKLAKAKAELAAGKSWDEVAKAYSDDPGSKSSGGLYKDIPFGRFAKEFEAAVRSQDLGKLGEPVKTSFGFHLIQVEARSPKVPGEFEKVKDAIRKQMVPERREKLTKAYLERIRKDVGFREVPEAAAAPAPAAPAPPAPPAPTAP